MDFLNNNVMLATEKSLNYVWQKKNVVTENIANISTPGYKAKYVTFEEHLRSSLSKYASTDGPKSSVVRQQIEDARIHIGQKKDESNRLDGNNVNYDVETTELARVQIQYDLLIKQLNDQFTRLRMAIDGR